jgi:general secretion pathway protein G
MMHFRGFRAGKKALHMALLKAPHKALHKALRHRQAAGACSRHRVADAGVTLIEMMVVLVIIGIVAALVVPNVIGRPDEARVAVARADLKTIAASLEMYRLDSRSYPTTEQGLSALTKKPTLPPVPPVWAAGGYLAQMPVDPWGQPYLYRSPADEAPYELLSLGSDGAPGGEGVDADISTLVQGG